MKKIIIIGLAVLSCAILINCDGSKDALDVSIETEVSTILPVNVFNTNEATYSVFLNAELDQEIQKYADKIKSYEITELLFAIENYNTPLGEDEIYFNGSIGFGSKTSVGPESFCVISNLPITNYANTGSFELNDCNNKLSGIAGIFLNDNAVKVYLIGSATKAPVNFDVKIIAKVKVTANPL